MELLLVGGEREGRRRGGRLRRGRAGDGRAHGRGGGGRSRGTRPRGGGRARRLRRRVRGPARPRRNAAASCSAPPVWSATGSEDLARLEARNGGKPITAARGEIGLVANVFEYWGGAANKIIGETIPIQQPGIDLTLREPVGVCALITPVELPGRDRLVEDRAGARVRQHAVVKPASQTPLTALALARRSSRRPGCRTACSQRAARARLDDGRRAHRGSARVQDQLHRDHGGRARR